MSKIQGVADSGHVMFRTWHHVPTYDDQDLYQMTIGYFSEGILDV